MKRALLAGALALLAIHGGCAKVAAPTGGPEDKSLPRVLALSPDSGAVGVRPDTISILFSKRMDRGSVRDWLFVNPPLAIREWTWDGNRLELVLSDPPDTGITYGILIGSDVFDRRKNPLGPYSTAFSTGRSPDDGVAEGQILGGRIKGAGSYLYVWFWSDSIPGGPEGDLPPPLKMGQAGKDGRFAIPFLPRNRPLRICALYDAHRDRSYDPEDDFLGCLEEPLVLGDTSRVRSGLSIYLVLPDEPGQLKGKAVDSTCVRSGAPRLLALRREADSLRVLIGAGVVKDSIAGDSLIGFGAPEGAARVDTAAVRARLAAIGDLRQIARVDSARCALPVLVRLFEKDTSLVAEVRGSGGFEFRDVSPGTYRIRAFRDEDANGVAGPGEAAGDYPFPIEVRPGRVLADLDFSLRPLP